MYLCIFPDSSQWFLKEERGITVANLMTLRKHFCDSNNNNNIIKYTLIKRRNYYVNDILYLPIQPSSSTDTLLFRTLFLILLLPVPDDGSVLAPDWSFAGGGASSSSSDWMGSATGGGVGGIGLSSGGKGGSGCRLSVFFSFSTLLLKLHKSKDQCYTDCPKR